MSQSERPTPADGGAPPTTKPTRALEPLRLEPVAPDRPRTHFHAPVQSDTRLRSAIAWFGFRSFWGHFRRFAASAIATEDVDTRDWMEPTPPDELARKVSETLGAEAVASCLSENLGRDVWIDFIADTGDDAEVSERVARMMFREYEAEDPLDPEATVHLPRGDLLVHGGDVAYPVGTADEIHDRLVVPWNRALLANGDDEKPRVILGVPGNHDWYDGIDGFARMFRERHFDEDPEAQTEPLDSRWLGRAASYVGRFFAGETVKKSKALVVLGYKPLQRTSYFVLPITPSIHLYAADRQLRRIDYRQRRFFQEWAKHNRGVARILVMHDPVFPFGRPSRGGLSTLHTLRLSPEYEPHLCLTGDVHHYRRETLGRSIHVTAGGGGAFLHPTPFDGLPRAPAEREWPGPAQSKSLLRGVWKQIALGRSGLMVHAALLLLFVPALGVGGGMYGREGLLPGSIVAGLLSAIVMWGLGGFGEEQTKKIAFLAALAGTLIGLIPLATLAMLEPIGDAVGLPSGTWTWGLVALAVALGAGGLVFGGFITALTALGYEHTQAFTALAHHGYKHFVRMRVRADGAGADVFVIGVEDVFDPNEKPSLVDSFFWESPASESEEARRSSLAPSQGGLRPSLERRRPVRRGDRSSRPSHPDGESGLSSEGDRESDAGRPSRSSDAPARRASPPEPDEGAGG